MLFSARHRCVGPSGFTIMAILQFNLLAVASDPYTCNCVWGLEPTRLAGQVYRGGT